MHPRIRLGASGLMAGVILASAAGVAAAHDHGRLVGHVYTDNNAATHNTIGAFDRWSDGSISPMAGSPFAAGGAGTGAPIGSAGALQESADGRFLLAVDPGSDQVSVLRIQRDGSLRLRRRGVVSSGGHLPVSIAIHDRLVYVANAGAGGSDYTGFRLGYGGHLRPIAGSTFALPDSAMPGQVLFSGDGRHLAGTRVGPAAGPSSIDSFSVDWRGRLTAAPGSPFPAQRVGPFGSEFRPTDPDQLFVSNAHDGAGNGSVSAYHVSRDGTLTAVAGSPFADDQTAPCWVEISHDGRYLFAVNTAVPSISSYRIARDGSLNLLGSTPFQSPSGLRPFDARLDPSGRYLYVVDAGVAKVSVFAVDGGNLHELGSSPFAIAGGSAPFGLVVD